MGNSDIVISCDWFSLSCHLREVATPPFLPAGWKAVPMGRTAVWSRREYVMSPDGVKVGTILMEPISPMIKDDRAVVEVSNQFLYRQDFHSILDVLLQCYPLEVDNVQRVDLCGDFEMLPRRWEVVKMLEDGRAYVKGLRRGVAWWQKDAAVRQVHQLSWGGKDSTFKWKLYNKHKELWEGGTCSKPYIEEMWRLRGLEPLHVWRLEVSITSLSGIDCDLVAGRYYREWWDKAVDIYRNIYADKFVVREDQGHKDKRCDDKLTFLDIFGEKVVRHRKPRGDEHESDVERRIVTKLWKEFTDSEVRCDAFAMEGLYNHICYLFQRYSNLAAICRRFKKTEAEVLQELEDAGTNFACPAPKPLYAQA